MMGVMSVRSMGFAFLGIVLRFPRGIGAICGLAVSMLARLRLVVMLRSSVRVMLARCRCVSLR